MLRKGAIVLLALLALRGAALGFTEAAPPVGADTARGAARSTDYYLRGLVPGWAQFHSGNPLGGYVYGGAFAAAGLATAASLVNYSLAKSEYDGLSSSDSRGRYRDRRERYGDAAFYVNVSLGALVSIYVFNWLDVLLADGALLSPGARGVAFTAEWGTHDGKAGERVLRAGARTVF